MVSNMDADCIFIQYATPRSVPHLHWELVTFETWKRCLNSTKLLWDQGEAESKSPVSQSVLHKDVYRDPPNCLLMECSVWITQKAGGYFLLQEAFQTWKLEEQLEQILSWDVKVPFKIWKLVLDCYIHPVLSGIHKIGFSIQNILVPYVLDAVKLSQRTWGDTFSCIAVAVEWLVGWGT